MTRFLSLFALTTNILLNFALVRFDRRRRRWLLPPLVRTNLPLPVRRKRLAAPLYVLSLYFFAFFAILTFQKTSPVGLEDRLF